MWPIDEFHQNINLKIFIKKVSGSEIASKLVGQFILDTQIFKFTSIAFGRIGGHNISISLSKTITEKIKKLGYDPEIIQLIIQRKLIEGDFEIPENLELPT